VRGVLRGLRDNAYGLLRGSAGAVHPSPRVPTALEELNPKPLTDWLADLIDLIAGKRGPQPLTFADLWAADEPVVPPAVCELDERARAIRLQMLSTCLNLGRPYRLPFEEPAARFYFRLEEWRRFFPERVVDHLDRHSCSDDGYRLVPGVQLPVVVAARLSLSFPFLFSAVPLYQKDDTGRFLRCWFSDGGITSNFPIHFFDALLPRWPTFGITLRGPRYRAAGGERRKGRFVEPGDPEPDRIETVKDFATSITDAARNWSDNRQSQLPGWRDRIAHVPFDQGQGGLNLKPDAATIRLLAERGAKAGRELVDRFATDPPRLWSENRWIRYRSTMYAITVMLERLQRGWEGIPPGETRCQPDPRSYEEVIGEFGETGPYPWRDGQGERAKEATDALLAMIRACFSDERFDGAPQPEPVLRITPDI
jgi:hypothetical protein